MTGSYLAGIARRATPGRAALLPPASPWGVEARQPAPARPVEARSLPTAPLQAPAEAIAAEEKPPRRTKHGPLRAAVRSPSAGPVDSESADAPTAGDPPPTPPAEPQWTEAEEAERMQLEAVQLEATQSAQPAVDVGAVPESKRGPARRRRRVEARAHAADAEEAGPPARPRTAERRSPAPTLRIESIEVVVERPHAPAPAPVRKQRPLAQTALATPPPALARGFSSLIGLRQG